MTHLLHSILASGPPLGGSWRFLANRGRIQCGAGEPRFLGWRGLGLLPARPELAGKNPKDLIEKAYVGNSPLEMIDPLGLCNGRGSDPASPCSPPPPGAGAGADWLLAQYEVFPSDEYYFLVCVFCGGGVGGGRGGTPTQNQQKQSYVDCVKTLANVDSIQSLTHAGNGFLASAFLQTPSLRSFNSAGTSLHYVSPRAGTTSLRLS